jgi:hypothetical protein
MKLNMEKVANLPVYPEIRQQMPLKRSQGLPSGLSGTDQCTSANSPKEVKGAICAQNDNADLLLLRKTPMNICMI